LYNLKKFYSKVIFILFQSMQAMILSLEDWKWYMLWVKIKQNP